MRRQTLVLASLAALLSSCTIGAHFSPLTPFEQATNGTYEGEGNGVTGRVPYRLTLTVQEKAGQASGVLQNLESKKTYAGSGTVKGTSESAQLDMNFFENGDRYRAALHAELAGGHVIGRIRTVLLGQQLFPYNINFKKVDGAAPQP